MLQYRDSQTLEVHSEGYLQERIKGMDRIGVKVKNAYMKIPANCKFAFLCAFLAGLAAHLYMFTNKLPNYDDMALNSFGATFRLGRWFLWVLGATAYHMGLVYSLPLVNGLFSLVLLAVSAAVIVELLNLKSKPAIAVVSSVLVVFPSWTATFFFMFTAPYYAVAVLLIVLSVYFNVKYKKINMKCISIICIACSLGIYQAYLPFAATLYVTVLVLKCYEKNAEGKKLFKKALGYLATLVLGGALYYVIMKLSLVVTSQQLADYKGVSQLGTVSFGMIPDIIGKMVSNGLGVAVNNNLEISSNILLKAGYGFLYLSDIIMLVVSFMHLLKKKKYYVAGMLVLFIAAFFVAVNSVFIMCPADGAVYVLMTYSYVFLIILPICIADRLLADSKIDFRKLLVYLEYGIVIVSSVMVLSYCHFANAQYLSIQLGYEQATSYYTSLVAQIKSTEGYSDELPVALISEGNFIADSTLYRNDVMRAFDISGRDDVLAETYSIEYFLAHYCGFSPKYAYKDSIPADVLENMPVYPAEGSIQIVNNIVVVKLS